MLTCIVGMNSSLTTKVCRVFDQGTLLNFFHLWVDLAVKMSTSPCPGESSKKYAAGYTSQLMFRFWQLTKLKYCRTNKKKETKKKTF